MIAPTMMAKALIASAGVKPCHSLGAKAGGGAPMTAPDAAVTRSPVTVIGNSPASTASSTSNADGPPRPKGGSCGGRPEEHTYELQSLMRISYADFCLRKKT